MRLFRGKLLDALRTLHRRGQLRLPDAMSPERFMSLLNRLGRKVKWNVRVCSRYAHGRGVSLYLARYVKGGPYRNTQIVRASHAEVCFATPPTARRANPSAAPPWRLRRRTFSPACSSTPPSRDATPCATTGCTRMPAPSNSTPPARCTPKPRSSRPRPSIGKPTSRASRTRSGRHPLPALPRPACTRITTPAAPHAPAVAPRSPASYPRRHPRAGARARPYTRACRGGAPARCLRRAAHAAATAFPGRPRAPFAYPCTHDTRVGLLVPPASGAYNFHRPKPPHTGGP